MADRIIIAESWQEKFPGAKVGILIVAGVENVMDHPALAAKRKAAEEELKAKYSALTKEQIGELPVIRAYRRHYDKFHETYHVRLQLESIILKGKSRPNSDGLIESMFIPELKNFMLTAGHDFNQVIFPVIISASSGEEIFTTIRGQEQKLKPADMIMSDQSGVISSVLYGPDSRTRLKPETTDIMYITYAPAGVEEEAVLNHLNDITDNIKAISPSALVKEIKIYK